MRSFVHENITPYTICYIVLAIKSQYKSFHISLSLGQAIPISKPTAVVKQKADNARESESFVYNCA